MKKICIFLAVLLTVSCMTAPSSSGTGRQSRGSLSSAMDKAKKSEPSERKTAPVQKERREYQKEKNRDNDWLDISENERKAPEGRDLNSETIINYVAVEGGYSSLHFGPVSSRYNSNIVMGASGEQIAALMKLGISYVPVTNESEIYGSINGLMGFSMGWELRGYVLKETQWNILLQSGLNGRLDTFNYANPLYTDVYDERGNYMETERITTDALAAVTLYTGTGVIYRGMEGVELSLDANVGITSWHSSTEAGFDNDVFPLMPYGEVMFRVAWVENKQKTPREENKKQKS